MDTLNKLLEILCGALLGLLACAMLTLFCGCSTPQPVVVERVVVKTDTLYKARTSAAPSAYTTRCMLNTTLVATQCIG